MLEGWVIPRVAPDLDVTAVEKTIEVEFPRLGATLIGRIDAMVSGDIIADTKTKVKAPKPTEAHDSFQFDVYDLMHLASTGKPPREMRLQHLVVTPGGATTVGKSRVVEQKTWRTDSNRQATINRIFASKAQIEAEIFPPARPGRDWWCSKAWCEFYQAGCKYVR